MSVDVSRTTVVLSGFPDLVALGDEVCRTVYGTNGLKPLARARGLKGTLGRGQNVSYKYGTRKLIVKYPIKWAANADKGPVLRHGAGMNKEHKVATLIDQMVAHLRTRGVEAEVVRTASS